MKPLGAGGTLLKSRRSGCEFFWLIMTNKNEKYGYSSEDVAQWRNEAQKVQKSLAFLDRETPLAPIVSLISVLNLKEK